MPVKGNLGLPLLPFAQIGVSFLLDRRHLALSMEMRDSPSAALHQSSML